MDPNTDIRLKKQKNKIRKIWNLRMIRIFTVMLAGFFVLGLIIPLRPKTSDLEKRSLAECPAPSFGGIWDGSFFNGVSTWYSDSYPFREGFLTLGSGIESLYGIHTEEIYGSTSQKADAIPDAAVTPAPIRTVTPKPEKTPAAAQSAASEQSAAPAQTAAPAETAAPTQAPAEETLPDGTIHAAPEVAGTVYIADNKGFEVYYFNRGGAEAYASMINTVRSVLPADVTVYDLLAPTNFSVCLDENIQYELGGSSARDAFDYINSMLDPSVKQIETLNPLIKHNAEYIYYGTDHHWTALGAYYAYVEFCKVKGITPHELSYFPQMQFPGFLGTFYSYSNQSEALGSNPDTVTAYVPVGTNDETVTDADGSSYQLHVINDMTDASAGSKYSAFIGGDSAFVEIHNPQITDGSSCVMIKESYGNAFVPFLVDHYQDVYVVDYRYYMGNLTEFIVSRNIKDVLFLNNADALSEYNSDDMLALFY